MRLFSDTDAVSVDDRQCACPCHMARFQVRSPRVAKPRRRAKRGTPSYIGGIWR